jgi:hypothetical protein
MKHPIGQLLFSDYIPRQNKHQTTSFFLSAQMDNEGTADAENRAVF